MGAKTGQTAERNHNWKGGRTIASNGYVLVRRPDHPSADSRGYVYEHRLVMEEKLGRPLEEGEIVHHVNHTKTDNRPENLEVVEAGRDHHIRHRKRADLQRPGEANFQVPCACGCGAVLWKYDGTGRPRRFISGHNGRSVRG